MTAVGFIGLGRMGGPMATNLLKAGFRVIAYDPDPSRIVPGAEPAAGAGAVAQASDIVISMIMNDAILHQVALGPGGVIENLAQGAVYADLSTVTPAASAVVGRAAAARGRGYLCGAVAGSIGPATEGTLTLFASGEAADFETCRSAFAAISARALHVGSGDAAAYLKLVHSFIIGVYSAMLGEALAFGEKGGLDLGMMVDVLEAGPLGSKQLTLKAPILKGRQFDTPPSDIDTAAKDVDMILETARKDAMPLPVLSAVRQLMAAAQASGAGKRDIYAILEASELFGGLR
ncbi:MAG: NAD(P)-dependent oxidoreductase [Defluviimonas sp.]|uniref:NAD(P)-dependent oxidoreductase n=1 Tax=Albidovulum sp. TaxID=1872424 RepID=UPI001DE144BE|nr:NAD(P)-dependent oxidoreductase [Paracoccaceae bacterium]MCC0063164.1 NAD(P)-dependent oxidoreductase [Defluviimonas sp.]